MVVLAFFFSARHVLVFSWLVSSKPFQIPPTTDCQQRQSTRASILVHRTHRHRIVSYRIGILPRRHVQSILKLSAQIPTCRIHNMCVGFEISRAPTPKAAIPPQKAHITTRLTHSVSVLSGYCWLLVRPLQRRPEHGGSSKK